jgi:hypothetical protein
MTSASINDVGLLLDIVGAVLLFKFGLPAAISREGHVHLVAEQVDEAEIRRSNRYDRLGKVGLALLVDGFALQLISNHV